MKARLAFMFRKYWTLFFISLIRAPVLSVKDFLESDTTIAVKIIGAPIVFVVATIAIIYYQLRFIIYG